jgi:hypothetical protein
MAPDGDELGLIEGKNFHLGLGRDHRVIGNVDVQRADLKGVLEILAAQIAPDLAEIAASALKRLQGAKAVSGVRGQAFLHHSPQPRLYSLSDFQTLAQWIGLAQLCRLLALKLGVELPAHSQQTGFQLGRYGQQVPRRQRSLGVWVKNAGLIGQERREPAAYSRRRSKDTPYAFSHGNVHKAYSISDLSFFVSALYRNALHSEGPSIG